MTETQEVLLRLMKEFDQICVDNDIEYLLSGGTALGAVRHGGFLPWDDDVDIFVTRPNYEKLDKIMCSMEFEDRAWVSMSNSSQYLNPIARYFDTSTTAYYKSVLLDGSPNSYPLEIFVGDPFPVDEELRKRHIKLLWLYTELQNPYYVSANRAMSEDMLDIDLFREYQERVNTEGLETVVAEIDKALRNEGVECDSWCGRWSYKPIAFKNEWVEDCTRMPFEDTYFPVGKYAIHRLVANYGNAWDIIPQGKNRIAHGGITDTSKSYLLFEDRITQIREESGYDDMIMSNAVVKREAVFSERLLDKAIGNVRNAFLQALADSLGERRWEFDANRLDDYNDEFRDFFSQQFYERYAPLNNTVEVHDDLLETMLLTLLYSGRLGNAQRLLEACPSFSRHKDYVEICALVRDAKTERFSENAEELRRIVNRMEELGVGSLAEAERSKAWLVSHDDSISPEGAEGIFGAFLHRNDMEVKMRLGDIYRRNGNADKANALSASAANGVKGMLVKHMKDLGYGSGTKETPSSRVVLQLLSEIHEACTNLGIDYIVGGAHPAFVNNDRFNNTSSGVVFVDPSRAVELLDALKGKQGESRFVEFFGNNSSYPFFSFRYVDTNSTFYACDQPLEHVSPGIFVEVVPVRFGGARLSISSRIKRRACLFLDRDYARPMLDMAGWKNHLVSFYAGKWRKSSDAERARFFETLCSEYSNASAPRYFYAYDTSSEAVKGRKMPISFLTETKEYVLAGAVFRMPIDLGGYVDLLFDRDDEGAPILPTYFDGDTILAADCPFETYRQQLEKMAVPLSGTADMARSVDEYDHIAMQRDVRFEEMWSRAGELYACEDGGAE